MSLRRTPLYERHVALGARMVAFGGWEMPVQYEGIVAEHRACRSAAALFDVSHMGKILAVGAEAAAFLQRVLTNDVVSLAPGAARYSLMCDADGGILDDMVVYRQDAERFLLIVNAANMEADWRHLAGFAGPDVLCDVNDQTALLALQGPAAKTILSRLLQPSEAARLAALKYYRFGEFTLVGAETLVARTGYTGGPGYELVVPAASAGVVWDRLLEVGAEDGLVPAGLGARDTLRLEAGFCLHGHDIGPDRNPVEADLLRFVALDKGDFVGRSAILKAAAQGPNERLVGLEVVGRGVIRAGHPIAVDGRLVGVVTSGSFAPSLDRFIGLGYVSVDRAQVGTRLEVMVRERPVECQVVERPFWRPS